MPAGAGREKGDVEAGQVGLVGEGDAPPAGHLLPCRALRGKRDDLAGGKVACHQQREHRRADGARGTDDGDADTARHRIS